MSVSATVNMVNIFSSRAPVAIGRLGETEPAKMQGKSITLLCGYGYLKNEGDMITLG